MVPRRCRRGSGVPLRGELPAQSLQWCRVVVDAESARPGSRWGTFGCFNGAASLSTRNLQTRRCDTNRIAPFNGAASLSTRNQYLMEAVERAAALQWCRVIVDAESHGFS